MKAARSANRSTPTTEQRPATSTWRWRLGLVFVILAICGVVFADWWKSIPADVQPTYLGGQSCIQCHSQQHAKWRGSYHDLAMDRATPETVLGDFDNRELGHFGIVSRMFQRDGKYYVHTEGPTGELADFEVKFVLGVAPLQQYMVEFDRPPDAKPDEIGRLQVLPICWDTHQKKWFFLQPPDVSERVLPNDDLHWTGFAQRWNNMCADCHVTDLHKNYDVASQTYRTTFTDMDVNCEACHGPGSLHVQLASAKSLFWDRKRGYALAKLKDKSSSRAEIETCAPCHSMRHIIEPGFRAGDNYYDYFVNESLQGHLYHADGQILEEVYEFGSFAQSKMYHKGIRCTDCHDPHTTKVKHEGNQVCTSCHQHPAGKYDSPAHHHHDPGKAGAKCTGCHMPTKTYMAVDPRLDHSLRVPRPDLSVQLSTPNACSGCHLEKSGLNPERAAQFSEYADWIRAARGGDQEVRDALAKVDRWSADQFRQWYGEKKDARSHFAYAFAASRRGELSAIDPLLDLAGRGDVPAIVRATSVTELGQFESARIDELAVKLLKDPEPLVRLAAVTQLERLPDDQLVQRLSPLLSDSTRAVRAEAGRVMARVDERWLKGPQRIARQKAIEEFRHGLLANSDRAIAHLGLGILAERQGNTKSAQESYETAMRIEPNTAGPRANLAALLEQEAESSSDPAAADALRGRVTQLRREELDLLARDAKLLPENGALRYRYGLSLYLHGRLDEAERELNAAVQNSPNMPDFILGLALLYQKQQKFEAAIPYARRLTELRPNSLEYEQLLNDLQAQLR